MKNLRIVFLGTPDFAVESLRILVEHKYNIVAVVTAPDKPAGRGQKVLSSPVKVYAEKNGLNVFQPTNLKDENFIHDLKLLAPDLQIVVAFRMLPEIVWNLPPLGTFNLHASLLPQYRGAAPINWAIINGERETGVTTFFLEHQIDTGKIILQEKVEIKDNENARNLHDKLMEMGAKLVLKTVQVIEKGEYKLKDQQQIIQHEELKIAPKIFKEDCKIDWKEDIDHIYNKIRGLSPYPAAWTEFKSENKIILCKIFACIKHFENHHLEFGSIISDTKAYLKIAVKGGFINITELQQSGKKRLKIVEFLRGFQDIDAYSVKE